MAEDHVIGNLNLLLGITASGANSSAMKKYIICSLKLPTCLVALLMATAAGFCFGQDHTRMEGYDLHKTGLIPRYPDDYNCSPLTSLYASWDDVDGTRRDEVHSGVDGGRLGDPILAPASGEIRAAWKANWGWGEEGALLLRHTREELGLQHGPEFFYSEFDHLRLRDASRLPRAITSFADNSLLRSFGQAAILSIFPRFTGKSGNYPMTLQRRGI